MGGGIHDGTLNVEELYKDSYVNCPFRKNFELCTSLWNEGYRGPEGENMGVVQCICSGDMKYTSCILYTLSKKLNLEAKL